MYDEKLRLASESVKPKKDIVLKACEEDEENPARPSKKAKNEIEVERKKALEIIKPELDKIQNQDAWARRQEALFSAIRTTAPMRTKADKLAKEAALEEQE